MDEKVEKQYSDLQLEDFKELKELFEEFVFAYENWEDIVKQLSNVLDKCDEIDYEENETALAYALWHFLDRYHRFQMMIKELWKRGYLQRKRRWPINILEVGCGPAQGLFAFSEHYAELSNLEDTDGYKIGMDYVEQSGGFRNFLHHFVEFAMGKGKHYEVPFHHGRAYDAFNFTFEDNFKYWWGEFVRIKYRYNIVIISNFLTTQQTTEDFKEQLKNICKHMRNHGLLIIVGASDKSDKYKKVYSTIDEVVNRKFNDKRFRGWWNRVYEDTFSYNFTDEYGEMLRDYYKELRQFMIENKLWENVPKKAQNKLEININQTKEKTLQEGWEGIHWKVVVYQKHSFYKDNMEMHEIDI